VVLVDHRRLAAIAVAWVSWPFAFSDGQIWVASQFVAALLFGGHGAPGEGGQSEDRNRAKDGARR
jgi:hypothetical protein